MGKTGYILAIFSFALSFIPFFGMLMSCVSLVLSIIAIKKNKSNNSKTFGILGVIYSSLSFIMAVGISAGLMSIIIMF